ncbi:MAG: O-antigen ligase family protein [Pirellulaceae bacterium]|jgi:O-antigen ligase|nr:O-antigen ligase family protein [Pirellulaceae bacterium]
MSVHSTAELTAIGASTDTFPSISRRMVQNGTLLIFWALAFVSFSLPGRFSDDGASGMDLLGQFKLLCRFAAVAWAVFLAAFVFDSSVWRCRVVNRLFAPWWLFSVWAFLSVTWSALKVFSIGQAMGLVAQIALAWCLTHLFTSSAEVHRLMRHLSCALLLYSAALLAVYAVAPSITGLERSERMATAEGLVHPTASGGTASLGLVLLVGLGILGVESHGVVVLGIAIQMAILYISRSRSAVLCAALVLPLVIAILSGWRWVGHCLTAVAVVACCLLLFDPSFQYAENALESGTEYLKRGQNTQQLAAASGRMELWIAILEQVQRSPIIGHGYFVTSAEGWLDVWDGRSNRDAHNIVLQVLATTGLVGLVLMAIAAQRTLLALAIVIRCSRASRDLAVLIALALLWYFAWGTGCTAFMGPVRPESVIFFGLFAVIVRLYKNYVESIQPLSASGADIRGWQ